LVNGHPEFRMHLLPCALARPRGHHSGPIFRLVDWHANVSKRLTDLSAALVAKRREGGRTAALLVGRQMVRAPFCTRARASDMMLGRRWDYVHGHTVHP
jgi:hypothetical protein